MNDRARNRSLDKPNPRLRRGLVCRMYETSEELRFELYVQGPEYPAVGMLVVQRRTLLAPTDSPVPTDLRPLLAQMVRWLDAEGWPGLNSEHL